MVSSKTVSSFSIRGVCVSFLVQEAIARRFLKMRDESTLDVAIASLALSILEFKDKLHWTLFEDFNRDYQALRIALAGRKRKFISMAHLHKGAWIGEEIGAQVLSITKTSLARVGNCKSVFPISGKRMSENLEKTQVGVVYKNAPNAPFDIYLTMRLATVNQTLITFYECRHSIREQKQAEKVRATEIQEAVSKAASLANGIPFAMAFISNRPFMTKSNSNSIIIPNDSLPAELAEAGTFSNAIIVVKQNCIDYVGPSLWPRFVGYMTASASDARIR